MAEQTYQKRLKLYRWRGWDNHGRQIDGQSRASDPAQLKSTLQKQGVRIRNIQRVYEFHFARPSRNKAYGDITRLTKQLALLLSSGISLAVALELISQGCPQHFQTLFRAIKQDVVAGNTLSTAVGKQPYYFDEIYCSIVAAGEQSSTLAEMLLFLTDFREQYIAHRRTVLQAIRYPAIVLATAIAVVAFLLALVVPRFEIAYVQIGAELPALTRGLINIADGVQLYGFPTLMGLILLWWLIFYGLHRSKFFALWLGRLAIHTPIVGVLFLHGFYARFCCATAMLLKAGLPLIEVLKAVYPMAQNKIFCRAIEDVCQSINRGATLHSAMLTSNVFGTLLPQMVSIGEEMGNLQLIMETATVHYNVAMAERLDRMTDMLEPAVMLLAGLITGTTVVALYLPIFQIGNLLQ